MKWELYLIIITAFLVYNTWYDGRLIDLIKIDIKHFKIACYIGVALVIYLFIKKHPIQSQGLLIHAHDIIKYMPIDKQSKNIITPIIDYTKDKFFTESNEGFSQQQHIQNTPQFRRMMNSGGNNQNSSGGPNSKTTKRSVSETKKKYVASNQQWKCGHCHQVLDHTFEVDHIVDLRYGGDNNVQNLIALCRNCHGKKTLSSKL